LRQVLDAALAFEEPTDAGGSKCLLPLPCHASAPEWLSRIEWAPIRSC
jgi:hypothetical protein